MQTVWSIAIAWLPSVLGSAAALAQGSADTYPTKPVVVVASIAPGGVITQEGRLYTTKMSELMGQQFVMDFKPGAAGTIGSANVARGAPDGYTLLIITGSNTVIPSFYKDLPFDIVKDFAPVSMMSKRTSVLVVHPSFPAKTFREYVAYARANPGKINYGASAGGGVSHLAGAWLHSLTGTQVTFIAYKGAGPQLIDQIAGRVDVAATALISALPLIRSGKLRPIGVMDDRRSELLPGVPTIAEQGVPEYNYANWFGIVAPAATPVAIVNKLSDAFAKVARSPDVARMLAEDGSITVGSTPAQLREVIISEASRWRRVIQENGIKLEE